MTRRGMGEDQKSIAGRGEANTPEAVSNRIEYGIDVRLLELWARAGFISVPGQTLGGQEINDAD